MTKIKKHFGLFPIYFLSSTLSNIFILYENNINNLVSNSHQLSGKKNQKRKLINSGSGLVMRMRLTSRVFDICRESNSSPSRRFPLENKGPGMGLRASLNNERAEKAKTK